MLYSQISSPYNVTNACWVEPSYNLQAGVRIAHCYLTFRYDICNLWK